MNFILLYLYLKNWTETLIILYVIVENESHCDFVKLREMLIGTNMEDMREKTHCRHYELYRKKRLEQVYFIIFVRKNKKLSFS